ncbi:MAG: metal-sulfur cluster assembly factor [Gemmatimonadaceae bacterium]|nr:metal-sulfur cluster assembly factor [Gemmatimonadota bacterium]MBP9106243.1 metal-sulfur cluster assembly factor [Gemmatimonadaceae bacterium]MCC7324636.1 metal-sulfur cluster assembly factor [Gemmatimonadaceae bacterium]
MLDSGDVDVAPTTPAPSAPPAAFGGEGDAVAPVASVSGEGAPAEGTPNAAADSAITADQVKLALRRVKDPELNLNILDLGLIYDIAVEGSDVSIDMSLTSPGCPSGPEIMGDAERQLKAIEGIGTVAVNLVWSPPWTPDRIEPRVRAYLGF